jgi:signal transduction histidine kinase
VHLIIVQTCGQQPQLALIFNSSKYVTYCVGSILDFAQLDSGLVELSQTPLNICDIIESCIDMVAPDALKKSLEVTVSAPRAAMANIVLGDGLRMRQVLVHLLSNAVKFTEQGSVEVEVEAEETASALKCALKVCLLPLFSMICHCFVAESPLHHIHAAHSV